MSHTLLTEFYPALAELPANLQEKMKEKTRSMAFPAGAIIFDEHQPCTGFPLIFSGSIRVLKLAASGRELPLYRLLPGDSCIITASCLLGHIAYNARGVAETDSILLVLPRELFEELLGQAAFRRLVFRLFSERIAELMQLIDEVAFRKLDQRLAALLLGKGKLLQVTHQQLADELGSVREMISRLLKGFADGGLVRLGRERIEIVDPAGLRRIAG